MFSTCPFCDLPWKDYGGEHTDRCPMHLHLRDNVQRSRAMEALDAIIQKTARLGKLHAWIEAHPKATWQRRRKLQERESLRRGIMLSRDILSGCFKQETSMGELLNTLCAKTAV
jgi:hypothetical protein